jgi:hypothetical protein
MIGALEAECGRDPAHALADRPGAAGVHLVPLQFDAAAVGKRCEALSRSAWTRGRAGVLNVAPSAQAAPRMISAAPANVPAVSSR